MGRTRKVDSRAWQDFVKPMPPLAVGATAAHPGVFPTGRGIGRRVEPRNEYLGLVVTRREANTFVLGLNYFDTVDNGDNEDIYRLDTATFEVTPYMRGGFEKEYAAYAGYHRAAKPYLRKAAEHLDGLETPGRARRSNERRP
jgi:hypothetical protein